MGIWEKLSIAKYYYARGGPYVNLGNFAILLVVSVTLRGWEWWYLGLAPLLGLIVWFETHHAVGNEVTYLWRKSKEWLTYKVEWRAFREEDRKFKSEVREYMRSHP